MTDNDYLALKLKAAAEKAKEYGGIAMHSKAIKADEAFKESANPAAILALLAERDADKSEIERLCQQLVELEESKANLALLYDANLCDMLAGPQYMDPPDGGQVDPIEQVARMVEDYRQRIAELETVCAESYQVVGSLAGSMGVFNDLPTIKALDNLSAAQLHHKDVLPFAVETRTVSVKLPDCDFAAVQHISGGSDDYCNGFVDGTQNAIKCVKADCAAAGINLEVGE